MGVDVTTNVDEGVEKSNVGAAFVDVEKSIVLVGVGVFVGADVFVDVTAGVRVGMFGTQRSCPAKIVVDEPMQLARCSCG